MPNVDWCETNQEKALRSNIIGTMNVSDLCAQYDIHCTLYATGCTFEYDDAHTIGGKGFTEEDKANFDGSFYSKTKVRRRGRGRRHYMRLLLSPDASLPILLFWAGLSGGNAEELQDNSRASLEDADLRRPRGKGESDRWAAAMRSNERQQSDLTHPRRRFPLSCWSSIS